MNKTAKILGVVAALLVATLIIYSYRANLSKNHINNLGEISSPKDASYVIDGKTVSLTNGVSDAEAAPGSASRIVTKYFGNEVKHDFDGDGREDLGFILTQTRGGTGTYYYFVFALNTVNGYVGSNAFFLGDRIAPQTTSLGRGTIVVVNYADRGPNDAFSIPPMIGKTVWLQLDKKSLEIAQIAVDFEGEADPGRMSLGMKTWSWVTTVFNDNSAVTPKHLDIFKITFDAKNRFQAQTDCNSVGGEYVATADTITLKNMMSTLKYCENSQESDFTSMLSAVSSYHFTSKGELIIDLNNNAGTMYFR